MKIKRVLKKGLIRTKRLAKRGLRFSDRKLTLAKKVLIKSLQQHIIEFKQLNSIKN